MMSINLYDYQIEALNKIKNGSILCGSVGSGKSRTAIAYYFELNKGSIKPYKKMEDPIDLYIITTARKRDTKEWEGDLYPFLLSTDDKLNGYSNHIYVDSWNNISKYVDVKDSFFIFDEQRVVGDGAWVNSFLKITKNNKWILLSATPGDTWTDYIPVFLANGFYKNRTEFKNEHVIYSRFAKYPKVDRYISVGKLIKHRNDILVNMNYKNKTEKHHEFITVDYDAIKYNIAMKDRYDYDKDKPIETASELCYLLRRIVNTHPSRLEAILNLFSKKGKVIIFYNFNYELEILKTLPYYYNNEEVVISEWNGLRHEPVPDSNAWVYLVQYTAGAEGWNCIKTDTIIFYSQNYSYKVMIQSAGRIDRLNTPYSDLYFYHLQSKSPIDLGIRQALKQKKKFNETNFVSFNN